MNPEFPMRNTTLCYLEQDGKWLMLHRVTKKNDMNHDKWIGVGGKFEPFESPEDCLLREVREETGLQLTRFRCRGIVTFILGRLTEYMHLYTADGWTGELIRDPARNEGVLEWVPTDTVETLPIWEGDKIFFRLLKEDAADAFVSAGSSGALLVGSTLKVGRIDGVIRPALCPILPTVKPDKKVLLLDAGANADCKAANLVQFAVMGAVYAKVALGVKTPKVALLSNGTEEKKGNQLNHEAFPLLKEIGNGEFVGNIEARDIMSGDCDVVVADGFSGNVALKSMEGSMKGLFTMLKAEISSSLKGKIGALLLKKSFYRLKNSLDYNKYGGAVFLGVEKVVVKAHGSAKAESVKNAVLQAAAAVEADTVASIKAELGGVRAQGTAL